MAVKPIIFSGPMVRALLAGTKTQTRRVLNPQPFNDGYFEGDVYLDRVYLPDSVDLDSHARFSAGAIGGGAVRQQTLRIPYAPGDLLYVREAWRAEAVYDDMPPRDIPFDACQVYYEATKSWSEHDPMAHGGRYRHARFMPKWASRLTPEVTDVRVQRVRDISPDDAIAEGIDRWMTVGEAREAGGLAWGTIPADAPNDAVFWIADYDKTLEEDADLAITLDPREAYRALWDSLHGEGAWDRNDWVAAYSFTVHQANVDDLLRQRGAA